MRPASILHPRRPVRHVQPATGSRGSSRSSTGCSVTSSAPTGSRSWSARRQAILAAGPAVAELAGGPPPGDTDRSRAQRRRAGPDGRDRRLAVPVPPDAGRSRRTTSAALAFLLVFALCHRPGAARVDGHADPALQPALLRAGRRVPAARDAGASSRSACSSARPGSSTRWRSSRSSPACCSRSRSTRGCRPRGPAHPLRRAVRARIAVAWLVPADALLIDPPELRYVSRGDRVRAGVLRQPRVHVLVPRHGLGGHGVRVEPARRDGRRRARVRRASHRLPALLIIVGRAVRVAFVLARRVRFLADVKLVDDRTDPLGATPSGPEVVGAA